MDFFNSNCTKNYLFAPDIVRNVVNTLIYLIKIHLFLSTMDLRTIFGFYLVGLWYNSSASTDTSDQEITKWLTDGIFTNLQSELFGMPRILNLL